MNIIIIGGSSGIGKSLAELLATKNHQVIITGRRENKLKEIQSKFLDNISYEIQDVTNLETSEQVWNKMVNQLKSIDLVIYSSGIGEANYDLAWEKEYPTLQTNITGAVKIFSLAYQFFKKQGYGHIVGISSVAGIRGNRHVPAYFASKAFLSNYLESLWLKGKRSKANISVTGIIPGFVDTAMAQGKTFWMATPEKAANQIYKALLKKKKRVYITKRWILVACFLRILPARFLLKM
jgi:short-subunit dehydrogenase